MYMCMCVHVCACMHVCVHVCECACVCMHVCVCVLGRVWEDRMDETGRQRGKHSLEERLKSLPPLCCSFPSWGLGFGTAPSHLPPLCDAAPSATVTWSYPKLFPRAPSERHSCIHRGHTQYKGLTSTRHIFKVHIDSKRG